MSRATFLTRIPALMLYFDHNATSPLLPEARQAWLDAVETYIGNPSSPHRIGSRAEAALTQARETLAEILGCDAMDIVWTSSATESNNMVLHHFARTCDERAEIWISAIEHPCIIESAAHYFPKRHRFIPATRNGEVSLTWLKKELARKRPALIAAMAANNETGVLQPWHEILALCRKHHVPFFCDAVQWIGKLPTADLGKCDFLSGSAHKFGGPKGVAFLKCASKELLRPLLHGGPQEDGRRAGTENVAGVLAMVAALQTREKQFASRELGTRLEGLEEFANVLLKELPGSKIVGGDAPRLWNTLSVLMPQADCQQRWVVKLDKLGIAVSTGSACSSGHEKPSHVLAAMGYSAAEASRMLRFSSSWETKSEDWDALLAGLIEVQAAMKPGRANRPSK